MRLLLRAAMAAVSIGSIPPAMAGESAPNPNTFTDLPGVIAQAPAQTVPSVETAQRGALHPDTHASYSPWLFPPIGKYLDQHAG
jgi:hypothetical protein